MMLPSADGFTPIAVPMSSMRCSRGAGRPFPQHHSHYDQCQSKQHGRPKGCDRIKKIDAALLQPRGDEAYNARDNQHETKAQHNRWELSHMALLRRLRIERGTRVAYVFRVKLRGPCCKGKIVELFASHSPDV